MLGNISCFEIVDNSINPNIALVGSGRLRKAKGRNKEIFFKEPCKDIPYELDYGVLVPRRVQAREWNGGYLESVFV